MIERLVKIAKKNALITKIRTRFPRLFLYLVVKPLSLLRYKDAKRALSGKMPRNLPDRPSILLFTTEKCASTYTKTILTKLTSSVGMFAADIEAYFSVTGVDRVEYFQDQDHLEAVFNPRGRYLGPLRAYYPIRDLNAYKKILVLRDPRDVLTSYYYSIIHSHIVISEEFLHKRKHYASYDLDSFVIEYLPEVKTIYDTYIDNLLGQENLVILPYELLVTDFEEWLSRLLEATDLTDVDPQVIQDIIETEHKVAPDNHKTSHIRNKLPGDFRRQLLPETQQYLTQELSDILQQLDYEL